MATKKRAQRRKATSTKSTPRSAKKSALSAKAKRLHRKALRHNWDFGLFALDGILFDKACDFGTALAIYWMGAPGFNQQYRTLADAPDWLRENMRFLRKLEKRLLAREFATAEILFNPRFDCTTVSSSGHDWTAEYAEIPVKRPIPGALKEPSTHDPAWEKRGKRPIKNTANRLT